MPRTRQSPAPASHLAEALFAPHARNVSTAQAPPAAAQTGARKKHAEAGIAPAATVLAAGQPVAALDLQQPEKYVGSEIDRLSSTTEPAVNIKHRLRHHENTEAPVVPARSGKRKGRQQPPAAKRRDCKQSAGGSGAEAVQRATGVAPVPRRIDRQGPGSRWSGSTNQQQASAPMATTEEPTVPATAVPTTGALAAAPAGAAAVPISPALITPAHIAPAAFAPTPASLTPPLASPAPMPVMVSSAQAALAGMVTWSGGSFNRAPAPSTSDTESEEVPKPVVGGDPFCSSDRTGCTHTTPPADVGGKVVGTDGADPGYARRAGTGEPPVCVGGKVDGGNVVGGNVVGGMVGGGNVAGSHGIVPRYALRARTATPRGETVPALRRKTVSALRGETVSALRGETVPALRGETVPALRSETVTASRGENVSA
jgi:hypothetical protein